ncbi:hypothetical protein F5146DRAFT_1192539, partial [Armillaria mellea]
IYFDFSLSPSLLTPCPRDTIVDGWESSLQINDITSLLLALRPLPHMLHAAKEHNTTPRICVAARDVHHWANVPKTVTDRLPRSQARSIVHQVLNVFFSSSLQSHLPESIIVNAINPGFCQSELRRSIADTWYMALADWVTVKLLGYSTEEGNRQRVWADVGGEDDEKHLRGGYVSFSDIVKVSEYAMNEERLKVQERI